MAALRIFARSALTAIRSSPVTGNWRKTAFPIVDQIQNRWNATVSVRGPEKQPIEIELPDFEVSKDPEEWMYVEWSLRDQLIPKPPTCTEELPSGWKPQSECAKTLPYFVERTKNHMIPVYLKRNTHRGLRRVTHIRRIQGDIMLLEKEMRAYVQEKIGKSIGRQINEPAGMIKFRGDYVSHCKNFLASKGF